MFDCEITLHIETCHLESLGTCEPWRLVHHAAGGTSALPRGEKNFFLLPLPWPRVPLYHSPWLMSNSRRTAPRLSTLTWFGPSELTLLLYQINRDLWTSWSMPPFARVSSGCWHVNAGNMILPTGAPASCTRSSSTTMGASLGCPAWYFVVNTNDTWAMAKTAQPRIPVGYSMAQTGALLERTSPIPSDLRPWFGVLCRCGPQWPQGLSAHYQERGSSLFVSSTLDAWLRIQDTPLEPRSTSSPDLFRPDQCFECLARQTTFLEDQTLYHTYSSSFNTSADSEDYFTHSTSGTTGQSRSTSGIVELWSTLDSTCCPASTAHAICGTSSTTTHYVWTDIFGPHAPSTWGHSTSHPNTRPSGAHTDPNWHARPGTYMIVEDTITIDQPIPVLPTPSIRVPQREQLPALQPFGGHHDVYTPRPDLTSLPLYCIWQPTPSTTGCSLPGPCTDHGRDDALAPTYHHPRWWCPDAYDAPGPTCGWTDAPDGARILPSISTAPGARLGPTCAIRYQLRTPDTPTLVLPSDDLPTVATDYIHRDLPTSPPYPRDALGLACPSSAADDLCIPWRPWYSLLDQQSGRDHCWVPLMESRDHWIHGSGLPSTIPDEDPRIQYLRAELWVQSSTNGSRIRFRRQSPPRPSQPDRGAPSTTSYQVVSEAPSDPCLKSWFCYN